MPKFVTMNECWNSLSPKKIIVIVNVDWKRMVNENGVNFVNKEKTLRSMTRISLFKLWYHNIRKEDRRRGNNSLEKRFLFKLKLTFVKLLEYMSDYSNLSHIATCANNCTYLNISNKKWPWVINKTFFWLILSKVSKSGSNRINQSSCRLVASLVRLACLSYSNQWLNHQIGWTNPFSKNESTLIWPKK